MDIALLKVFAGSTSKLLATSAHLAKKQAELATLNNVALPKLYYSVGKRIARLAELPPELTPFRERIALLEAGLAKTQENMQPASEQIAAGFAAKAKQVAQQVAQKASQATANAATQVQIHTAYVACGKEAVQRFGLKAIPKEWQADWAAANDQIEKLTAEIAELQAKNSVGAFTPRRLVLAGGTCAGVLLAAVVLRSAGGLLSFGARDTTKQQAFAGESDDAGSAPSVRPSPEQAQMSLSIRRAIGFVLGEESTQFKSSTFRGLRLGDRHVDDPGKSNAPFESPHFLSVPPHKPVETPEGKTEDTRAMVERAGGRIVGISCLYEASSLSEMGPTLIETFGRTPQEIETQHWQHNGGPAQADTIKYTFPHALVRVSGFEYSRPFPSVKTRITVFDRPFLEKCLMAHGQAVVQSCLWLQRMRRLVLEGQVDEKHAISLAGCDVRAVAADGYEVLLYVDSKRERAIKEAVENLRDTSTPSGLGLGGSLQPFDVALYVNSSNGTQLVVCPDASGSMRGPEVKLYSEHLNGSLLTSPMLRSLVQDFTSAIVQEMIPPVGENISQLVQTNDLFWEPDYDAPTGRRVQHVSSRADGNRHEWTDQEGWQVRVTERGAISLVRRQGRSL